MDDEEELEQELRRELASEGHEDEPSEEEDALEDGVPCDRCGDFHAPGDLSPFDGAQMCVPCIQASCDKPWSPRLIGGISFLLGFGGAGVVHAINQRRLGRDVRVLPRAALWVVGFAVAIVMLAFAPDGLGRGLGLGLNIGALMFFARAGHERYEAFKAAGGETGSAWSAIGIALGMLVVAGVTVFGALFVYGGERFAEGQERLDAGDLDGAYEIFEEECEAGEPAACTNAGWIDEQRDDYVSARRLYRQACDADEPMGCANLGLLWEAGRGGPADVHRARSLYQRGCELGEPTACESLSRLGP